MWGVSSLPTIIYPVDKQILRWPVVKSDMKSWRPDERADFVVLKNFTCIGEHWLEIVYTADAALLIWTLNIYFSS